MLRRNSNGNSKKDQIYKLKQDLVRQLRAYNSLIRRGKEIGFELLEAKTDNPDNLEAIQILEARLKEYNSPEKVEKRKQLGKRVEETRERISTLEKELFGDSDADSPSFLAKLR